MKLPKLFGSYLLHHQLAWSETSEVFIGQTLGEFPRLCVVKRVRPELCTLPEFDERFRKDAALLLRLIHGNVVQVLEVGAVEGQPFVAMEHIDGIDVHELVDDIPTLGQLDPEVALYLGLEMCEAVSYICQRRREYVSSEGLLFDLAWPLDVMVSFDGVVKVISPGSVGALRLGQRAVSQVLRSPGYTPPEVALRQPLDARSDVFSVGVVLWELLAGTHLIADNPDEYVQQVLQGRWRAPLLTRKDVPGDVIRLLSHMLELDPDKRPISPETVRAQLVSGLRRMAPAFGSGQMARLLLGRYTKRIGLTEELTEKLMRRAATVRTSAPDEANGHTLTYGRADDVARPVTKPAEIKPGDRIPGTRYRMVRQLGRGGSAEVVAAQHIDLDRQAAIKILAPELATQQSAISYFRLEARTCSRIGHPNIIDVTDFGELDDGRFFFAMELLQGESLGDLLGSHRRLAPARAIPIFRQIAKALQAAHEHGVIHRDLKPENVMVVKKDGRDDFVKVLDFGVMAFAADQAAERVGTPGYMPPEQVNRERPTACADVYAMGATLYETLCGELPYDGETMDEYHEQQCAGPPPALRSRKRGADIHPAFERVIHRALERGPATRHPSAADFEADLIRAQHEAGISTPWDDLPHPDGLREQRDGEPRRNSTAEISRHRPSRRAYAFAGVAAALLLLLGALFAARTRSDSTTQRSGAPDTLPHEPATTARAEPTRPRAATAPENKRPPTPVTESTRARRKPTKGSAVAAKKLVRQGRELLRQRRLAEARQHFEAALVKNPRHARAALGLAAVAFQRARYGEAVKHARRAIAFNRRLAPAHLVLGDAYAKLHQREKALRSWRRALALDPKDTVASTRIAQAQE